MSGDLPGHFVYRDERAVAFLSINPINPGHTLVVPVKEVSHWIDLEPELVCHLMVVAQKVGKAQMDLFSPERIGVIVAGFEVPHTHLHLVPVSGESELSFARAARTVDHAELAGIAGRLAFKLGEHGQ